MAKTRLVELSILIRNKQTGYTEYETSRIVAVTATPAKIHALVEMFTTTGRNLFTAFGSYSGPDALLMTVEAVDHISGETLSHISTVF